MYKIDETWKYKTKDWVRGVALSEGGQVAVGSSDHFLYLFNRKGELLLKKEVESGVMCCEFSLNGNYLITGLHSGAIIFFDKVGNTIWGHNSKNAITSVSISKQGEYSVVGSKDKYVYFFNHKGELLWKYETGGVVSSVSLSNKGDFIIVGSHDDYLYYLKKNGEILWKYNLGSWVNSVDFTSDGFYVVAGSQNKKLYFLDNSGELLWEYETNDSVKCVKISEYGEHIAVCNGNLLEFFDKHGRREWKHEFSNRIESIAFSKNGKFLVIGAQNKNFYYFNEKGELLWNYPTGGIVRAVSISSDGVVVLAGSDDYYAYFFDLYEFYYSFIKNAEKALNSAIEFGVNIEESDALLQEAKRLIEQKKYEESMNFAIHARNSAIRAQKYSKPELNIEISGEERITFGDWNYLTITLENFGTAHAKKINLKLSGPMKIKNMEKNFDLKVGEKKELKPIIKPTIEVSHFKVRCNCTYQDANGREYFLPCSFDVLLEREEKKREAFFEESGDVSFFKYKYVTKKAELKICPFCTARFKKEQAKTQDGKLRCPKCGAGVQ